MQVNLIIIQGTILKVTPSPSGKGGWVRISSGVARKDKETGEWLVRGIVPKDFLLPSWIWNDPNQRKQLVKGARVTIQGGFRSYEKDDPEHPSGKRLETFHLAEQIWVLTPLDEDKDVVATRQTNRDFLKELKSEDNKRGENQEDTAGTGKNGS